MKRKNETRIPLSLIAKKAKVSPGTVSRVFNDNPLISERTRARVLEITREMGVRPHVGVRRTHLAFVTEPADRTVVGGYVSTLIQRLSFAVSQRNISMTIVPEDRIESLGNSWFDGVIAAAWRRETIDALARIENIPVVWFNRPDLADKFNIVATDHFENGRLAAEYGIETGHRRLASFLVPDDPPEVQRIEGMKSAMLAKGLDPSSLIVLDDLRNPQQGINRIKKEACDFVWVPSDDMHSLEISWLLQEIAGLRIPEDVSLMGMEKQGVSQYMRPALTTFSQPFAEMAGAAVDLILANERRKHVVLPVKLIERQSVKRRGGAA